METRGYQLLLVEDDPDAARLLAHYLTAHGVKVRSAGDGEEAWRLFLEAPPQVVLTDLMLPWVSGAELVSRIRSHPLLGGTPVVVMTASLSSRERAREMMTRLSVQDAFSKPLALKELLSSLDAVVAQPAPAVAPPAATVVPDESLPPEPADLVDDTTHAAEGPNSPTALCALAVRLFEQHQTTVLTVRDSTGVRRLVFADGLVVGAETSVPSESLAGSLLAEGVLDARLAALASRIMLESGVGFELAVQQALGVEPWVLASALERKVRRVLWRALCAADGDHVLSPWGMATPLSVCVEMDPVRAIQEAAMRVLPARELGSVLAPLHSGSVMPGHAFEERAAVLRGVAPRSMVPHQVQSWRLSGGRVPDLKTMDQDAQRQLAALLLSGAVNVGDTEERRAVRRSAVVEAGGDWSAVGEPRDVEARNVVALEVLRTHGADAYAVLQVAHDASDEQVAQAVLDHMNRLGPPALDGARLGPARTALAVVRARRNAALNLLAPAQRKAYDEELRRQAERRPSPIRRRPATPPRLPTPQPVPVQDKGPRLGPYQLVERMAVGGAAEIFRCVDTRNGATVVLKRLRPDRELDLPVVTGFIRECELATTLDHPNVVKGLDRGSVGGMAWLVMEFVDGVDLDRLMQKAVGRPGGIPQAVALFIIRQVLDGLHRAHVLTDLSDSPLGLVHRDLAPRNVLLGRDGSVKLADFGGSVFTLTELAPPEIIGSAGFLSPEQARMEALDARSDLFAVGCILHQLLTGAPAFNLAGRDDDTVLRVHQEGRVQPVPRAISGDLRMLLEIACAPDREDRYRDAASMRDDVDRIRRALGPPAGAAELSAVIRDLTGSKPPAPA